MRLQISSLHRQLGATMVYVTHDQVEAMTMADRIVVLRDGRIEQTGTPTELYSKPANLFVAGFIGSPRMNLLSGTATGVSSNCVSVSLDGVDAQTIDFVGSDIGIAEGERVTVGIRPENIVRAAGPEFAFDVEVASAENLGGSTLLHVPDHPAGSIVVESREETRPGPGPLRIAFDPKRLHLFNREGAAVARSA